MLSRQADVPIGQDPSVRFLPWLVAFMVYLAALALTCAMAMQKVVERWDQGLAGRLTVQVPPPASGDPDLAALQIDQVIDALADISGVRSVELLNQDDIADLLKPWLGETVMQQELPLPTLIAVALDETAPPERETIVARLGGIAPGIVVDDHQRWLGRLLDLARTIETIAALIVVAVMASAVITIIFVTRTGLAIHNQVIDLLHLIGAQDSYVARQFENHALLLGLRGGVIGLLLAVLTVLLIGYLLERSQSGILPALALSFWEWLILISLPAITAAIAMVTARFTVLHNLSRVL